MWKYLLLLVALLQVGGCATVVKGSSQTVPVSSDPPGADVVVNNMQVGVTPTQVALRRKEDHLVTVQKEGYVPASVPVLKSIGGAVWGNILAGGIIGWGVDATTGAQYNLHPETIFVRLRPVESSDEEPSRKPASDSRTGISRLRELDAAFEEGLISEEEYGRSREKIVREFFPEMLSEEDGSAGGTQ